MVWEFAGTTEWIINDNNGKCGVIISGNTGISPDGGFYVRTVSVLCVVTVFCKYIDLCVAPVVTWLHVW